MLVQRLTQRTQIVTTSKYVVPTGRVKVPAGRYVVPTGKDNVIVSAGRSKVIPAGRTILVLIQRISLTGFPAQSVGSSNTNVLDSPCLLVLITGTSQSRQHGKSESDSYYLSD
ncbi:hypothetical protein Tco_0251634 [Tanacetum coccineum]